MKFIFGRSALCMAAASADDKGACRELVAQNLMVLEKMAKHTTIKATSSLAGTQFSRCACTASARISYAFCPCSYSGLTILLH